MAKEPITKPCKTKKRTNNNNKKNKKAFSEFEIDAAQQLIQLNGDTDSSKTDKNNDVVVKFGITEAEQRDGHMTYDLISTLSNEYCDDDQTTIFGLGPRKNKRFKSLREIYSLTQPLISIVN